MVITGLYNVGKVPFRHVYIHPKILDAFGEGMSKTKGNGIDPLDIIDRYGTDALRFGMVHLSTENQDSRMPVANVCPHCDALVPIKQEHMYMRTIYDFTWSEFCDWYVEMSKGRLKDATGRSQVQRVLVGILDAILRLVHPIMPFVAESIWQALAEAAFERGLPSPEPAIESVVI